MPTTRTAAAARAAARGFRRSPPLPDRPALVPLLRPLSAREQVLHEIRNRLTYIAGAARTLRRRAEKGSIDAPSAAARLERIESAAWSMESSLDALAG